MSEQEQVEHRPLSVSSPEAGWLFVECSCTDTYRPIFGVWLEEHWRGSNDEGLAIVRDLIAKRNAELAERDA